MATKLDSFTFSPSFFSFGGHGLWIAFEKLRFVDASWRFLEFQKSMAVPVALQDWRYVSQDFDGNCLLLSLLSLCFVSVLVADLLGSYGSLPHWSCCCLYDCCVRHDAL